MLTRAFAVVMTLMIGALALEMVFGVPLGIGKWVHGLIDNSQIHLI